MSEEFVSHADWPFPKAEQLENKILRDEIERLTKELFAAKSTRLPQREPLTDEAVQQLYAACLTSTHHIKDLHGGAFGWLVRIIERAHGIGGEYE